MQVFTSKCGMHDAIHEAIHGPIYYAHAQMPFNAMYQMYQLYQVYQVVFSRSYPWLGGSTRKRLECNAPQPSPKVHLACPPPTEKYLV